MIGVVIPAHNEEAVLDRCLKAVAQAAKHPALRGEQVKPVLVLDSCTDRSAQIAAAHGITALRTDARNVGVARRLGAQYLLTRRARWLAFTDADSAVPSDWLAVQVNSNAQAFLGLVTVDDWNDCGGVVARARFDAGYVRRDEHPHIHGANMGVEAHAYKRAGGFMPLARDEDVTLVESLIKTNARICRSANAQVLTSGRIIGKAEKGFAAFLSVLMEPT